jgi:glucosylceramidase
VALDERGRPNIGPFDCGGLVQIHSKTKEITMSGLYWALTQYARAFRRGAVIVASHDANGDAPAVNGALIGQPATSSAGAAANSTAMSRVFHTAAKNSDGSMVLVLANPGEAKEITVACAGPTAKMALTADSVTTLRWS